MTASTPPPPNASDPTHPPSPHPFIHPSPPHQDIGLLVSGVGSQGGVAFNMTWEFVFDRVDDIFARFKGEAPRVTCPAV